MDQRLVLAARKLIARERGEPSEHRVDGDRHFIACAGVEIEVPAEAKSPL